MSDSTVHTGDELADLPGIHLSCREVQQAIIDSLSARGLIVPGRPYSVIFQVAIFDPEGEDAVRARVVEATHA